MSHLGPETKAIIEAINNLKKPAHENLNYLVFTIDLAVARANLLYELPGWFDHIAVGVITGTAFIRLNETTKDLIDLGYAKTINSPIRRFFITNDAQVGGTLILAVGGEATFVAEPLRNDRPSIFRYHRYSEDGAVDTFETSQTKTDTPTLYLDTFRYPVTLSTGKINRIHYRLNPTNAVTFTLRIWCNNNDPDYYSNFQMLYESPALQVDDTDYIEEDLDIPFHLGIDGLMLVSIQWTAAPGVTAGFIEVSGEKWS